MVNGAMGFSPMQDDYEPNEGYESCSGSDCTLAEDSAGQCSEPPHESENDLGTENWGEPSADSDWSSLSIGSGGLPAPCESGYSSQTSCESTTTTEQVCASDESPGAVGGGAQSNNNDLGTACWEQQSTGGGGGWSGMASTDFDSGILSFDQLMHQLPAVSLEVGSLTVDAGFGNSFFHNNPQNLKRAIDDTGARRLVREQVRRLFECSPSSFGPETDASYNFKRVFILLPQERRILVLTEWSMTSSASVSFLVCDGASYTPYSIQISPVDFLRHLDENVIDYILYFE